MATGLAGAAGPALARGAETAPAPAATAGKLPREVTIATVCQEGLVADSPRRMIGALLRRCEEAATQRPDLVVLPEACPFANLSGDHVRAAEIAGPALTPLSEPVAAFAAEHECYVVLPTFTRHGSKLHNTAVLFDRSGAVAGEYHKIRLTPNEIAGGRSPGPPTPPVFDCDFGKLGVQICFDIEWLDGWRALRDGGAEVVVWPSAFAGGQLVNTMAYLHRYVMVSSTRKDTSKICDVDGSELAATSRWNRWACATVNLEKAFLHTWPFVRRFDEVLAKYGPAVRITNHAEEEWSILESRSAEVRIADVLREFELEPIDDYLAGAERLQNLPTAG